MSRRGWLWLGTFYAASAAVAACGAFGVFWGNDLPYYERVGARIRAITSSDARVFIWGGSAAPLALSGRHGIPGFPTARFTAPPYSTPELESLFLARFDSNEPDLVVDLHLRGDNRFRRPLEALPPLARAIDRDYTRWADPALPWAYFYLRKRPGSSPGTARSALCRARPIGVTGLDAGFSVTSVIRAGWEHRWSWPTLDRDLRARYALAWAGAACAQAPSQLNEAGQEMTPLDLSALFESSGYAAPFSVTDPLWWASLAVVELQPRGEIKPR